MACKDLVIRLSQEEKHHFVASALEDGKPVASNSFELRFDELRILERLRELEEAAIKPESQVTFHKDFGQELYGKVLAGELKSYFHKQLEDNEGGLRISLHFDDSAQKLATLPWEFLHDGEDFLVSRKNLLISRKPSKLKKVQSPPLESILHMLVIISAPLYSSCSPLDTERERDRIMQAVDKLYVQRKIEVDFTDDATFESIQSYLIEKDYHIVHFTGHGTEVNGQGFLVLENEDLTARQVDNQAIADLFAERGIRLVVLSACKSADLADKLVRKGVSAVVAMQYSILDSSATGFAFSFYQALANGKAIDQSLTEARLAMRNAEGSNKVDFATPVLYLLDPECLLIGKIKPAGSELFEKPVMLGEVQVMRDGFVGRQKELRILQKAFLSGVKRAAIIHGWGGIGKTVLASRLALRMNRHFEGFYGHKCNTQTRPEDILNGLCAFLNMAGISALNQVLYSPAPLQAKTAALVSILNQKRFLIILDNFESCLDESHARIVDQELRQFVEHLLNATASNTKYIITTRYDFDPLQGRLMGAIEHLSVPEMPLHQAVWLMNSYSNLAGLDFDKKKQIYKAIGGHPWTIGMFAHHATTASVDCLLHELGTLDQELKDFTLFDKSYSELDEAARELLRRSSIFEEAAPVEALRWMMGDEKEPSPPVDKPLQKLLQWGLMARQEGRDETLYSVHTKVRDFVGREDGLDRRELQVRTAQYYERRAKASRNLWDILRARDYYHQAEEWETAANIVIDTWKLLARWGYIELAMGLLRQSEDKASATTKAIATGNLAILYQGVGDWRTALKLYGEVKEIFEAQGDRRNVAASLHQLGNVHYQQGNYTEAVKLYEQSLDIKKDLGDKSGIARSLHQLGNVHYQQGNYTEAVKLYEQSLDLAKDLGDKSGIASSLHQLGMVHYQQGNYTEAVKLYEQSLDLAKDLGDKSGIASSLHQLGNVHYQQGNYTEAVKLYEQSLDIKKDLGDKSGIASSLHQLGMVHQDQGNYTEAVKLYEQSLDIKKDLGDKSGIASSLHQLGMVHQDQGNYTEAVKLYEQSLDIKKDLGDKSGIARSLHQLGNVHYQQGNYTEAVKLYEQSLDLAKDLGDKSGIASSLHQLGMVHQDQGNYTEAVKLYEQSLDIKKDLGDKSGIARSLHQLGMVHQDQGNYTEAVKLYEQSLDIKKDLGDKSGIASSLHQLGNVHYQQGNYTEAVKLYEQSLDLAKDLGDKSGIASSLHQLGMVHQDQGNYTEAVKLYEQSLDLAKDLGDKSGIARSLHQLGMVHYQQGNYTGAVKLYEQSLDLAKDLGDKSGIARSLHQLGNVHYQQGNYTEAVKLYEQSLDIKKDLGDKSGIARSLHQLGNVHYQQGNYTEAVKLYEQSLDIKKDLGDKSGIASSLHQLGMVHQDQGNYTEAVKLYEQSLDILKDLGDKSGIARSLHQLGMVHYQQGNYTEAVKLYEQSLDILKDLGDKSGIARSRGQMGRIKEESKDFEGALGDYVTALAIFEVLHDPSGEIAKKDIARLKEIMGEDAFKNALDNIRGSQ